MRRDGCYAGEDYSVDKARSRSCKKGCLMVVKGRGLKREVVVKYIGKRGRARTRFEKDSKRMYARNYRRLKSSKGMGVRVITMFDTYLSMKRWNRDV